MEKSKTNGWDHSCIMSPTPVWAQWPSLRFSLPLRAFGAQLQGLRLLFCLPFSIEALLRLRQAHAWLFLLSNSLCRYSDLSKSIILLTLLRFLRIWRRAFLFIAGSVHRAVWTAAWAGGFSLFSVSYHTEDNSRNNSYQDNTNYNCCRIFRKPRKHTVSSFSVLFCRSDVFGKPCWFRIPLEEQHIHISRKRRAELIDHQRDRIGEATLISDCKPSPLCAVHLTLNCTYGGKARGAKQVEH